jgi:hypothetical protein
MGTATTRPGTGSPGIGTVSNGPATTATRYEDKGGVRRKVTRRSSPVTVSLDGRVFENARCSFGIVTDTCHGILKDGSSQHGHAPRASSGSKSVNAYQPPPVVTR